MHADLYIARKSLHALRDLIILRPGQDAECLERARCLVVQAGAALEDAACKELLDAVLRYAEDLYSPGGPAKWERPRMAGASYLRLQILSKLFMFQNRLAELETSRDIEVQAGLGEPPGLAKHGQFSNDTRH
jgi:hypothetical protein